MPDHPLLLATDGRWPLDPDGAMTAHALQAATMDSVTVLRVPNDATAYRFVPAGKGLVVIVACEKEVPVAPPAGWGHPVCWHVAGDGCLTGWNGGTTTDSMAGFVAETTGPTSAPPVMSGPRGWIALPLLTLALFLVAGKMLLRRWADR